MHSRFHLDLRVVHVTRDQFPSPNYRLIMWDLKTTCKLCLTPTPIGNEPLTCPVLFKLLCVWGGGGSWDLKSGSNLNAIVWSPLKKIYVFYNFACHR